MQSVVGVAMVPEAILEKLEPMLSIFLFSLAHHSSSLSCAFSFSQALIL